MKARTKENSKSKNKVIQKKNSNGNEKKYNNPFYPIKYFCFNDVKKIVNSKHKKFPISKNNTIISIIQRNTNKTKEDLSNNLDQLMEDVEIGKVYEIQGDDYEVRMPNLPRRSQNYPNINLHKIPI